MNGIGLHNYREHLCNRCLAFAYKIVRNRNNVGKKQFKTTKDTVILHFMTYIVLLGINVFRFFFSSVFLANSTHGLMWSKEKKHKSHLSVHRITVQHQQHNKCALTLSSFDFFFLNCDILSQCIKVHFIIIFSLISYSHDLLVSLFFFFCSLN